MIKYAASKSTTKQGDSQGRLCLFPAAYRNAAAAAINARYRRPSGVFLSLSLFSSVSFDLSATQFHQGAIELSVRADSNKTITDNATILRRVYIP
jgi:hypothetical protein